MKRSQRSVLMNGTLRMLLTPLLLAGGIALSGCIVAAPRPFHRRAYVRTVYVVPARIGFPGYWGPPHVWIAGRWHDR